MLHRAVVSSVPFAARIGLRAEAACVDDPKRIAQFRRFLCDVGHVRRIRCGRNPSAHARAGHIDDGDVVEARFSDIQRGAVVRERHARGRLPRQRSADTEIVPFCDAQRRCIERDHFVTVGIADVHRVAAREQVRRMRARDNRGRGTTRSAPRIDAIGIVERGEKCAVRERKAVRLPIGGIMLEQRARCRAERQREIDADDFAICRARDVKFAGRFVLGESGDQTRTERDVRRGNERQRSAFSALLRRGHRKMFDDAAVAARNEKSVGRPQDTARRAKRESRNKRGRLLGMRCDDVDRARIRRGHGEPFTIRRDRGRVREPFERRRKTRRCDRATVG